MIVDRKWAAAVIVTMLTLVIALGWSLRREKLTVGTPISARQEDANPQKEIALAYYKADFLAQDPEAAWEMSHSLLREQMSDDRTLYLAWKKDVARLETPADLEVMEWRRPQQMAYTYLFRSSLTAPAVVVVIEDTQGQLSVLNGWYWKGETLP